MKIVMNIFFVVLLLGVSYGQQQCQHADGPVKQSTIINYLKEVIQPLIPYPIPSIEIDIGTGFRFKLSSIYIEQLIFSNANIQLTQPNTVLFSLQGLTVSLTLNWTIVNNGTIKNGVAVLNMTNSQGTITALIEADYFQNTNATFLIGELNFETTDQSDIEPYWLDFKPVVIDVLQREVPNFFLEINTQQIKSLIYPIVVSLEPIKIPDQNITVGFVYGALTNMILSNIDFQAATMGRGQQDNEVVFELIEVSALINNNWEFKALGVDNTGTGNITINGTTISITVGLGEDSMGELTINLDNAKISIGNLSITLDGGGSNILNFLISYLSPYVISAIESTFQVIVCLFFNGIPS